VAGILVMIIAMGTTAAQAEEDCSLKQVASIDMGTDDIGGAYVPVSIAGHEEKLLIDTGGLMSMLTPSVLDDLQLKAEPINERLQIQMYGGRRIEHYVVAHDVVLGNMRASRMDFLVMPDEMERRDVAGTLAPDILRGYDVELDFAKGKFNLFTHDHCDGVVVYWTKNAYAQIPMHIDGNGHITVPVVLDGKNVEAILDTGSHRSYLQLGSAQSIFGWDDKTADLKPIGPPNASGVTLYHFPFHTLTLEGLAVYNPDIVIDSGEHSKIRIAQPLIIGMGILSRLHLYLAYREHNVYATPAEAR
jgi:predicted aspartyl protease